VSGPRNDAQEATRLGPDFYARPARVAARHLLGKRLVRLQNGRRLAGIIVEAEAYCDAEERDLACHGDRANQGRPTARTEVMFGPAGFTYVYFTYGVHWMLNVVTGQPGTASAVLLRALQPDEGVEQMRRNRGGLAANLASGPARLAQALAIARSCNGANLCAPDSVIWIEERPPVPDPEVAIGPRIGLGKTPEPWLSMPWRFWIRDNPFVSRR
jgi:DNA-3-methyladenine glycosylase